MQSSILERLGFAIANHQTNGSLSLEEYIQRSVRFRWREGDAEPQAFAES
jgi:hypothetical protein